MPSLCLVLRAAAAALWCSVGVDAFRLPTLHVTSQRWAARGPGACPQRLSGMCAAAPMHARTGATVAAAHDNVGGGRQGHGGCGAADQHVVGPGKCGGHAGLCGGTAAASRATMCPLAA